MGLTLCELWVDGHLAGPVIPAHFDLLSHRVQLHCLVGHGFHDLLETLVILGDDLGLTLGGWCRLWL